MRYSLNRPLGVFALFLSALVMSPSGTCQIAYDLSTSATSTSNLLNDNYALSDTYSSTRFNLHWYPLAGLQGSLTGEQNYYRETIGLSNIFGQLTVRYIPFPPEAKFNLNFCGTIDGRIYHNDFRGINNNSGTLTVSAGYRLSPRLALRGGTSLQLLAYVNTTNDYKRDFDFFLGINLTFLGKNSLDIESGAGITNYIYKDAHLTGASIPPVDPPPPFPIPYDRWNLGDIPDSSGHLWLFYFSPRYSRPLGERIGLSLTCTFRKFLNYNNGFLWDISTGYLSPWTTVWEGQDFYLRIKTYPFMRLILSVGLGYWDKEYLITSEALKWNDLINQEVDRTYLDARLEDRPRRDFLRKIFVTVQRPLGIGKGSLLEPSMNLEYSKNSSSHVLYDYDDLTVAVALAWRP